MLRAHGSDVNIPSLDELNGNAPGVARPAPCHPDDCNVQDLDGFNHASDELSPEEEAEMESQYLARLEDERRAAACAEAFRPFAEAAERVRRQLAEVPTGYREAPCVACGAVLLVEVGTGEPLCPGCQFVEVA